MIRLGIGQGGLSLEQWRSVTSELEVEDLDIEVLGLQGNVDHSEVLIDRLLRGGHDGVVVATRYLPLTIPDGVEVVAYTRRRTPFAAFLTYDGIILDEFESGAVIGVEGPGQTAQLLHYRPELRVVVMRGGAQERLQQLEEGEIDALVVPAAWAEWLHIEDRVSEILSVDVIVPAAGQGSLCLLGRGGEDRLHELGRRLNDRIARREVEVERRTVTHLREGGVHIAAALAQQHGERMELDAMAIDAGGRRRVHRTVEGEPDKSDALARSLADEILGVWKREG